MGRIFWIFLAVLFGAVAFVTFSSDGEGGGDLQSRTKKLKVHYSNKESDK